jgi:hypothetical protein
MGLCGHDLDLLLDARKAGVSFERTLTVGHLDLLVLPGDEPRLARRVAAVTGQPAPYLGLRAGDRYVDAFFRDALGTCDLVVLDNSDYEGAGFVHDLNEPVPESMVRQFDAVVDGGTIEHVFDVRTALSNLMQMVRVGGSVFISTAANNLCGHGFYQFSPELMHRVFSPENGFEVRSLRVVRASFPSVELARPRGVYEVPDPATLGERVMLVSHRPVTIMVWATRTSDVAPFRRAPQQSDYVRKWGGQGPAEQPAFRQLAARLGERLPAALRRRARGWYELARYGYWNRRYYRPLTRD